MERKLFHACENGLLEEVIQLIRNHPDIDLNCQDKEEDNRTPFYLACRYGHIEIVKLLLNDKRVDRNKSMNGGFSPFYVACENGHIKIVKLLLNDQRVVEHPFVTDEEGNVVMRKKDKPMKNENGYLGKPINPGYQSHFTLGILRFL